MNNSEHEENSEQKSVLIVDENRKLVDLLSECCRSIGMSVWTAENAEAAAVVMESVVPDLMILDVDATAAEGVSYLQLLDTQESLCRIPAIVLSKASDLDLGYQVQNMCAYYVHKSPQAWYRIEIFASELVDLGALPTDESTDSNSSTTELL